MAQRDDGRIWIYDRQEKGIEDQLGSEGIKQKQNVGLTLRIKISSGPDNRIIDEQTV